MADSQTADSPTADSPTAAEDGFTLIEIVLASALTLLVMLAAFGFLDTSSKTANAVSLRSANSAGAREAIDALEANLRFANGFWVCGGVATTTTCAPPQELTPATAWARTGQATLFVTNPGGGAEPACDEWTIAPSGLEEEDGDGTRRLFVVPGVMAWVPPYASADGTNPTVQTTGFSTTAGVPGLVTIDLLVNSAALPRDTVASFDTGNAVSVHDFVAPDNLQAVPAVVLSAPLTTDHEVTTLAVNPLTAAIGPGSLTLTGGGDTQTFTTPGAGAGATAVPIAASTPNAPYPVGSTAAWSPVGSC